MKYDKALIENTDPCYVSLIDKDGFVDCRAGATIRLRGPYGCHMIASAVNFLLRVNSQGGAYTGYSIYRSIPGRERDVLHTERNVTQSGERLTWDDNRMAFYIAP